MTEMACEHRQLFCYSPVTQCVHNNTACPCVQCVDCGSDLVKVGRKEGCELTYFSVKRIVE